MKPPRHQIGRHLTAVVVTLLVILLPALVGGSGIDAVPHPAERAALGLDGEGVGAVSLPAQAFYQIFAPLEEVRARPREVLPGARLASLVILMAATGLFYLALVVVRGRVTALASCLALAFLPPIAHEGYVLRPELPSQLFSLFGLLLSVSLPVMARPRPGVSVVSRHCSVIAVVVFASVLFGLATACQPRSGFLLLLPGGCLALLTGIVLLAYPRWVRRRGWLRLPVHAGSRRLLLWLSFSLVAMTATFLMLEKGVEGDVEKLVPSISSVSILPPFLPLAIVMAGLAGIGLLTMSIGVGAKISRQRRITSDAVLLVYIAAMLSQAAFAPAGIDALAGAFALAVLVGDGGVLLLRSALVFHAARHS